MILKMWVRGKFVLCQRRFYNLLTKDKYHVFEVLIFFMYCIFYVLFFTHFFYLFFQVLSVSRNSLQTPSLDETFLRNFTLFIQIQLFWWET